MRSKLLIVLSILLIAVGLLLPSLFLSGNASAEGWEQVSKDGFGNAQNFDVNSMAVFNSDLYVGTGSRYVGCQVWRYDGSDWEQVNENGFGDPDNVWGVQSMAVFNSDLYVGAGGQRSGCQVWRYDGSDWELSERGRFNGGCPWLTPVCGSD